VDAIVGASKRMHTVLEALCTGCELCVAPCPVDCIELLPNVLPRMSVAESNAARLRHRARRQRLGEELVQQTYHAATSSVDGDLQALTAALARASARRGGGNKP
ncbi:4Fe-4S dicluster-binding protein, partial [Metallibacterium sp.]